MASQKVIILIQTYTLSLGTIFQNDIYPVCPVCNMPIPLIRHDGLPLRGALMGNVKTFYIHYTAAIEYNNIGIFLHSYLVVFSPFMLEWHRKSGCSHIYLQNILDGNLWPKFHICEELINIVLFYESAHRKVIKSSKLSVLCPSVWWQTGALESSWIWQLSKIAFKMLWNILKWFSLLL